MYSIQRPSQDIAIYLESVIILAKTNDKSKAIKTVVHVVRMPQSRDTTALQTFSFQSGLPQSPQCSECPPSVLIAADDVDNVQWYNVDPSVAQKCDSEPRAKQWVLFCLVRIRSLHRARPAAGNSINILWHAKCVFYSCVYLIVLCFILDWYFLCPSISWWMEQIKCVLSLIHTKNKLSMTSYLKNESKKPRHRLPSVGWFLADNKPQVVVWSWVVLWPFIEWNKCHG